MDLIDPALLPGWAAEIGATLLLKGSFLLGVAWLLTGGVRRGSAATRYAVWIIAVVGLLILPVLPIALPGTNLGWVTGPAPMSHVEVGAPDMAALGVPEDAVPTWSAPGQDPLPAAGGVLTTSRVAGVLLAIWAAGALALLARLLFDWIRVRSITARAGRYGIRRDLNRRGLVLARRQGVQRRIRVVLSDEMRVPVTWGIVRPVVLLPMEAATWSRQHLDAVLLHELAHVRRWDYLTHLVCEATRALYWPNPFTWMAYRRARMERERACDDAVLRFGTESTDYARLLLGLAQGLSGSGIARGALAMARPSMLRVRINDVLDAALDRRPTARFNVAGALMVLALVSVSVGTLRVWASPPRTESEWIAALEDPDVEMRFAAVRMLEHIGTDPAIDGLTKALTDESELVRRTSVWALGQVADARVVPALVDVVTGSHGDLHQKRIAATALRTIDARAARLAVEGQMLDRGPATRTVPGLIDGNDPLVWEPMVRVLLEGSDPDARARAAAALVDLRCEAAIPELIRATEDPSPDVRLAAAKALGGFDDWSAKRALARLLDDVDVDVRTTAEEALGCGVSGPP